MSTFLASSLAKDIKLGSITKILVQPIDFIYYSISKDYITALIWTIGNLASILIFSWFLYSALILPKGLGQFGLFLTVFVLNGFLSLFINMLIGFLGFWTTEITHLKLVTTQVISILSGALIPISYFPEQIQKVLNLLPFKYLVQFPIDVYLGRVPQQDIYFNIVILVGWVMALYFFARFSLNQGLKGYESFN